MNFVEQAFQFNGGHEQLLGIIANPEQPASTGVLLVVGGPQYRVGSHRQFVLLSRALASAGFPVMRFDHCGMGDSTGRLVSFEALNDDISAAISAFQQHCPEIKKVVLWGLCDAASASLLYSDATQDSRITGLILLNPWVRSEASLAKTHIKHYYGQRLLQAEFWRKLLAGQLGLGRALGGFVSSLKTARQKNTSAAKNEALPFQQKMCRGLEKFPGQVLLILSGNDYTAKEFIEATSADPKWAASLQQANIERINIPSADHTFSSAEWRGKVENITREWLASL